MLKKKCYFFLIKYGLLWIFDKVVLIFNGLFFLNYSLGVNVEGYKIILDKIVIW